MLSILRRLSKPIMIAVAIIISVAFIFFTGNTRDDYAAGPNVMLNAYGTEYVHTDVDYLQRTFKIAIDLQLPGAEQFSSYADDIIMLHYSYGDQRTMRRLMFSGAPVDYAPNVLVLRKVLKDYGIHASDAEVDQAFRSSGAVQVNGQFDSDLALKYEASLGQFGLKIKDVHDVIRDSIGLRKLQKLVAGNYVVQSKVADQFYTSGFQTIKAASIPFPLEDFKKTAKVTDEEIAKYYEENKEMYMSQEKRAISHVLIPKPNTEGKNAEDTIKIEREHYDKLVKLATKLTEPKVDFEAEVKAAGYEVKAVPAFERATPPDAMKEEYDLLEAIFTNDPEKSPISDPMEVKEGHEIFKVTKIEKPAQQELKDVKDKVRDTLVGNKAMETMQAAANDAKKKLEEAVKAGKKFEDAAKELKLTPQTLAEFSPFAPIADLSNGYEIAREAMHVPAGGFTKPLTTENGVILVYVISKELRKNPDSVTRKKNLATRLEATAQNQIFRAWFEQRYNEARIRADLMLQVAMSN